MVVISRANGLSSPKPTQRLYDGVWMSGLMILISTLPDKGEESLDLQSPLTTSPNLDNCISTAPAEQRLDDDDRHGYLTGSCGRHRQRSHTLCMLMAPASMHRRTPGFESLASPCVYQGRTHSHCFHLHVLQHPTSYL